MAARVAALISILLAATTASTVHAESPDLGFPQHPPELRERLARELAAHGADGEVRTQHRRPDGGPRFTNRLLLERSPYLRQHAHNPVDWYPWGPEALAAAAREGKPIFLSIGYSTCHWCHVMERESFDDLGIAKLLTESFIAIEVDREERPDLDEIYLTAMEVSRGGGGWPLQSFLTPEGKPFFAASYMPRDRLADVLQAVAQQWKTKRAEIEIAASSLADAVREVTAAHAEAVEFGGEATDRAVQELVALEDRANGGLGGAPKFPSEPELQFLLDRATRGGAKGATAGGVAERALDAMARGGIFDQVGGGFHRYATDAAWSVPHFEKMLYDQALLARAYLAGYRLTGRLSFRRAAEQTLDYVLREMTSPEGGFYSATDADSEGAEGRFFVWTKADFERALGAGDAGWAAGVFGVTSAGNFEDGRTVLRLPRPLDDVARDGNTTLAATLQRLDSVRERLRTARATRPPPLRDHKVLTAWNGMMITALAEAWATLGGGTEQSRAVSTGVQPQRFRLAAEHAADQLWRSARHAPGALWRERVGGDSSTPALLEDYAFLAEGLFTLYDATGDRPFLDRGLELVDGMIERFWDAEGGGFFVGGEENGVVIARSKSPQDGAVPSANAVALRALAMAWQRTGEARYRERADALLAAFSGTVARKPSLYGYLLLGRAELESGDTGLRRYAARGKVALSAATKAMAGARAGAGVQGGGASAARAGVPARDGAETRSDLAPTVPIELVLDIAPGWHVNSSQPRGEDLIATNVALGEGVAGWRLEHVVYPAGQMVRLGFQELALSVFTGRVVVRADLVSSAATADLAPVPLTVRLQACDVHACLRPEDVTVRVAIAATARPPEAPF